MEECDLYDLYCCSVAIVDVDLVAVVHGHIPGIGKLAGAEERCDA